LGYDPNSLFFFKIKNKIYDPNSLFFFKIKNKIKTGKAEKADQKRLQKYKLQF